MPWVPAARAMAASRVTSSPIDATSRPHEADRSVAVIDVSTVTARTPHPWASWTPAPSTAAASIAAPPTPCTVSNRTPSPAAARAAPRTVFGMSCNLRSRNTSLPSSRNQCTTGGPSATKSSRPTLYQAHRSPMVRTIARARSIVCTSRATMAVVVMGPATPADRAPPRGCARHAWRASDRGRVRCAPESADRASPPCPHRRGGPPRGGIAGRPPPC